MTDVATKLRCLPAVVKIAIAVVFALVLGAVGYLLFGRAGGGIFGAGAIFAAIESLFGSRPSENLAANLLDAEIKRLDRDADRVRGEAESRSRENAQARADAAVETARHAGDDDGGNPNSVFERHRRDYAADD